MATTLGTATDLLVKRVEQEGDQAVELDFAIEVYTRCEQIINACTKRILASTTLSTNKEQLLYFYRTEISAAVDIYDIRESGRRIEKCDDLLQLSAYDIDWFRKVDGTQYEAWCQVGRDILILYPGQAAASSVTVQYVKLLTIYTDYSTYSSTNSELPDEDIELALSLAEIVLLTRLSQLPSAKKAIERFGPILQSREAK